jgi:electron transport complex protein RnfG
MSDTKHPVIRSGFLLGIIALLGTALLAGVNAVTHERILEQEKNRVMQQLNAIVPIDTFNNDLLEDRIDIQPGSDFPQAAPVPVYRARLDDQPVAVLMIITAPDGYNGDIRILVGIDYQGVVLGVRIISHRETPGLGDPIELGKSDWILGFTGKSLGDPKTAGWKVKRDGGDFDQFTGATISPRAVVRAVFNCLQYFKANSLALFEAPAEASNWNE